MNALVAEVMEGHIREHVARMRVSALEQTTTAQELIDASEPTSGEGAVPVPSGLPDHDRSPTDHASALNAVRASSV